MDPRLPSTHLDLKSGAVGVPGLSGRTGEVGGLGDRLEGPSELRCIPMTGGHGGAAQGQGPRRGLQKRPGRCFGEGRRRRRGRVLSVRDAAEACGCGQEESHRGPDVPNSLSNRVSFSDFVRPSVPLLGPGCGASGGGGLGNRRERAFSPGVAQDRGPWDVRTQQPRGTRRPPSAGGVPRPPIGKRGGGGALHRRQRRLRHGAIDPLDAPPVSPAASHPLPLDR